MKRIAIAFCLLLFLALPLHAQEYDYCAGAGGAAAPSCTKANIPNGDVYKESFEDSGYDLGTGANAWNESGTPDEDYNISALGVATNQNCTYGLRTNAEAGTSYSYYHLAASKSEIWRKFSFYIASHALTNGQTVIINCAATGTDCSGQILGRVYLSYTSTGDLVKVYGTGDNVSTARTVALNTWYYVTLHAFDIGNCTDVNTPYTGCTGSGTGNGQITVGTTFDGTDIANADAFAGTNVIAPPDEWIIGAYNTTARTIDIIFGYDAVDDDGTF